METPNPSMMAQVNNQSIPYLYSDGSTSYQAPTPNQMFQQQQPMVGMNAVSQFSQGNYENLNLNGPPAPAYSDYFNPGMQQYSHYAPNTQVQGTPTYQYGQAQDQSQAQEQFLQPTVFSSSHKYVQNTFVGYQPLNNDQQFQVNASTFASTQESQLYNYNPQVAPQQTFNNYCPPNVNVQNYNHVFGRMRRPVVPRDTAPYTFLQQLQMRSQISKLRNQRFRPSSHGNSGGGGGRLGKLAIPHYSGGTCVQVTPPLQTPPAQNLATTFDSSFEAAATQQNSMQNLGQSQGISYVNSSLAAAASSVGSMNYSFTQMRNQVNECNSADQSPMASANTTFSPSSSGGEEDDKAYFAKVRELQKYTGLLVSKVWDDEVEKSSKIRTLLHVLSAPNQRVTMDVLLKCEDALKRMELSSSPEEIPVAPPPPPAPKKMSPVPFMQFTGAVQLLSKHPEGNHIWKCAAQPTLADILEESIMRQYAEDEDSDEEETKSSTRIPWVLNKELQNLDISRFHVKQNGKLDPLQLQCTLLDKNLPTVPTLKLEIPPKYPDVHPKVVGMGMEYNSTIFLDSVREIFESRMMSMSNKFTMTEVLNIWEMAVRQASSPNFKSSPREL